MSARNFERGIAEAHKASVLFLNPVSPISSISTVCILILRGVSR